MDEFQEFIVAIKFENGDVNFYDVKATSEESAATGVAGQLKISDVKESPTLFVTNIEQFTSYQVGLSDDGAILTPKE